MEKNNNKSRRYFLDNGLKLGITAILGGFGLSKIASKLYAKTENNSGETMELMTTDGTLVEVDSTEVIEIKHSKDHKKYNLREGIPNRKFVMVIDLAKCKNALSCQSACNKHQLDIL